MHNEQTSSYKIPQGKSLVSTELSLISSNDSKSKKRNNNSETMNCRINQTKTHSNKERQNWCCSTSLELYSNPWKIKKELTASDIGKQSRLMLGAELLENLVLPVLGTDARRDAESGMGTMVKVWDVDTMSMHHLVLKRWASFKNYVLIGAWNRDFVRRRQLKEGDEVGLLWDSYSHCFCFSVLGRN